MAGNHSLFGRFNLQDDSVVGAPQFEGQAAEHDAQGQEPRLRLGWDAVLSSHDGQHVPVRLDDHQGRHRRAAAVQSQVSFRNIDNFDALTASSGRDIPTHSFVNDLAWVKGRAHAEVRRQRAVQPRRARATTSTRSTSRNANGSWVDGVGTDVHARAPGAMRAGVFPAVSDGGVSSFGDTFVPAARHHLGDHGVLQLRPRRQRAARGRTRAAPLRHRRVRVLRAGQLEDGQTP